MTNKELAERIRGLSKGLESAVEEFYSLEGNKINKEDNLALRDWFYRVLEPNIQSILSEYQGEAVAWRVESDYEYPVSHDKTKVVSLFNHKGLADEEVEVRSYNTKYTNTTITPLYLSAPIKKENDNGR